MDLLKTTQTNKKQTHIHEIDLYFLHENKKKVNERNLLPFSALKKVD